MGNFEKLVVVAVLFVAAVVLAISFNRGGGEVEAADPLSAAELVLEQQGAGSAGLPALESDLAKGQTFGAYDESGAIEPAPSLLLNAGKDDVGGEFAEFGAAPAGLQPSLSLEPVSDPSQRILAGTVGLRPSFIDEYMVYTVAEGDTWSSLAQRFYQDGRYTRNLVRANDDLAELTPGNEILVPIFDFLAVDEGSVVAGDTASELPGESAAGAFKPQPLEVAPATRARSSTGPVLEYEVKPGDTLSDISVAVFGTATRWKELLTANSDKLATPESLQVGMKLKIPEGGKLPVTSAAKVPASAPKTVAKKPEAKPATTQPQASTPKKKKVL